MAITKISGAILMILSSLQWIFAESKLYEMSLQKFSFNGFLLVVSYYIIAIAMTIIGLTFAFPANLGLLVGLWEIITILGIIFYTATLVGWQPHISMQVALPLTILIIGLILLIYGSHQLQKVLG